jgi:hypothetical protein
MRKNRAYSMRGIGWKCVYNLAVKHELKRPLRKSRCILYNCIQMCLESVKWIRLAEDRDLWLTFISTMVSLFVSWKVRIFLSSWENIRFLKILHHGIHCKSMKSDQPSIDDTWSRLFYVYYCLGLNKWFYILSGTDNLLCVTELLQWSGVGLFRAHKVFVWCLGTIFIVCHYQN